MNKNKEVQGKNPRENKSKEKKEEQPAVEKKRPGGEILKQERMKQGLSLEMVHEATKIPLDALRAIEEGYKVRTLSPFYMKGFIKMYAKYLDVKVEDVLDDYKQERLPDPVKIEEDDFDLHIDLSKFLTKRRKKQILTVLGYILLLFVIFKVITAISHRKPKPPAPKTKIITTSQISKKSPLSSKVKTSEKAKATPAPKPVASKPAETKPAPVSTVKKYNKDIVLSIRAKKKGWITVKVDGEIRFRSSIGAGDVESWMADNQIEIAGNIINEIEYELNGKFIGPLGRKDRKAKRVIITKDGLKVSN